MFLSYKSVEVLYIFCHIYHSLFRLVYLYISVYGTYLYPRGFCCSSRISLLRSCLYSGIYTTASSVFSVYSTYLFPRSFCCSSRISLLKFLHILWHIHHSLFRLVYLYISVYSTYLFPRSFCCFSRISLLRSCIYSGIYTTASALLSISILVYTVPTYFPEVFAVPLV